MKQKEKTQAIERLKERGATLPCPRCGNTEFAFIDGYFNQPLQEDFAGLVIGGPSVPSLTTACVRCGFMSQHALGALGLLPPKEKKTGAKS